MKRLTLFLILLSGMLCAHAQEGADTLAQPAVTAAPEPAAEASPEQLWDRANTAYIMATSTPPRSSTSRFSPAD